MSPTVFGPESNGILMAPREFDNGEFDECWRYELINGVLVVSEFPPWAVADMNDELGCLLRNYRDDHPLVLDATLPGRIVHLGEDRRMIDRAIWAGLGRLPRKREIPSIIVDFVYESNVHCEFELRSNEFQARKVQEYWIIDRFQKTMTAHILEDAGYREKIIHAKQKYRTKLLPGFELPLARLLALADEWIDDIEDEA